MPLKQILLTINLVLFAMAGLFSQTDSQLQEIEILIEGIKKKEVNKVEAKGVYKKYCSSCHGGGGGLKIGGAKELKKSVLSLNESIAQIYFGAGKMNAFSSMLKPEEIIAVAKYIETLRK